MREPLDEAETLIGNAIAILEDEKKTQSPNPLDLLDAYDEALYSLDRALAHVRRVQRKKERKTTSDTP